MSQRRDRLRHERGRVPLADRGLAVRDEQREGKPRGLRVVTVTVAWSG